MKVPDRDESTYVSRTIMLVFKSIMKSISAETKRQGIDIPVEQIRILHVISDFEEPNQQELADHLLVDKSLLFRRVLALEEKGYVMRVKDEEDKRMNRTILTTRGLELVDKTAEIREEVIHQLLEGVSPSRKDIFMSVLGDMYKNATRNY